MTAKNLYISQYQAILEGNITKYITLTLYNNQERTDYPDEHPDLNYHDIFQDNNPEDTIDKLFESEAYKDFYTSYILKSKEISGNYNIACYQAMTTNNTHKLTILALLGYEAKMSYPNDHPEINYDDIFQDNDPDDVLRELLNSFTDFSMVLSDYHNPLSTVDSVSNRKESHLELMKHPLLDYCPNPEIGLSITDNLSSITYSTMFNKHFFREEISKLIHKSSILAEIFSSNAVSTTTAAEKTPSIALVSGDIQDHDPTFTSSTGGYNNHLTNMLVVTNKNQEINSPFLAHELSHKLMHLLFANDSNPYHKNSTEVETNYHQAIKKVLLNIKQFIKEAFDLDITIKDTDSTWEIGKKLSLILYPQHMKDNDIEDYISALKEHDLDINDRLPWLNYSSTLRTTLRFLKFDIANELVKHGVETSPLTLMLESYLDNIEMLDWALSNNQVDNINYRDENGKSALDHAENPKIIETLISAGAKVYPPDYEENCSINPNYKEPQDLSPILTKQLDTLLWFLGALHLPYEKSEEDCEFIVRLPQIIAADLYEGKIIDILAPMMEYWQEVISPAVQEYIEDHSNSDICLPLTNEYSMFLDHM
jgi:hypothetical protein